MPILTHDRIKVASPAGILGQSGILYGSNALQSITIGRHTPHDPVQAVGFLGIVDYTSGVITSDVQLDCILVEGCDKAQAGSSINKYAGTSIVIGTESYVLTSCGLAFAAGSPATVNFGFLTGTMASFLDTQAQPGTVSQGEESNYAVVMGDDGSGVLLLPTWTAGSNVQVGTVPYLDANGTLQTMNDGGLPAGIQSLNLSGNVNRDQVLDIRSAQAVQFVTTYPVNITMDLECYDMAVASGMVKPGASGYKATRDGVAGSFRHVFDKLQSLQVQAQNFAKHATGNAALLANNGDVYTKVSGLRLNDESDTVSVGRYLSHTYNYTASDLLLPLPVAP
jgi:hypothetical protein